MKKIFISFKLKLIIILSTSVMAFAADWNPLPDTQQITCYDNDSWISPCPAEGEPFHGQDASYSGFVSYKEQAENGVFTDSMTGFGWQESPLVKLPKTWVKRP